VGLDTNLCVAACAASKLCTVQQHCSAAATMLYQLMQCEAERSWLAYVLNVISRMRTLLNLKCEGCHLFEVAHLCECMLQHILVPSTQVTICDAAAAAGGIRNLRFSLLLLLLAIMLCLLTAGWACDC
jgi:hypothetical protein